MSTPFSKRWSRIPREFLPFADVASPDLPWSRLIRLSLFQVTVGMAAVLLVGTLNRVMIVELGLPAWLVSLMVALPLLLAPLRALVGFRSDHHRAVLGWKRVPYLWFGTILQFGGFAIMPFALLIMSGDNTGATWVGEVGAALAFLLVGAGMHTVQTAGLALATDLAPEDRRPGVVALLYVMLLVGMMFSGLLLGALLSDFSAIRLIQVIQGAAVLTLFLNVVALWKQEGRNPNATRVDTPRPRFADAWSQFLSGGRAARLLVTVGLGAAAFQMQDVLVEPYGGQVLGMSVGQTTALTALWSLGALFGFAFAALQLGRGAEPHILAAHGCLVGIGAFALVIFSSPLQSPSLLGIGVLFVGFGGGLFSVGTLTAAMALANSGLSGLALGAWGAVQASAAGIGIALAGLLRDVIGHAASRGLLGEALNGPATGYMMVWHLEIGLLFATLVAIGPLVKRSTNRSGDRFGLSEFPT
ncbi:MFS transporter [Sandaracinobacteroides saxicola]|uniref:MFS transporter n=1 Tax=Sandaracinobacteroides saxicola TaxID=2759707 RepID=A0A7G5IKT9_9SPHN|nr:MFS transporter [Sandaracinobacteroides saxicola]QMW23981.1 MFS transporter [Sandaracinobacteroides saxicola]